MKIDYDKEKVKMAVWGIGAYFPREKENIVEQFYQEEKIVLGYTKEQKPDYYDMFCSINPGDIVFIKSRFMPNVPLRVKAIGIVISNKPSEENGIWGREGLRVKWIKNCINNPIDIEKGKYNDGSTKALYQERDLEVIRKIAELLADGEKEKGQDAK